MKVFVAIRVPRPGDGRRELVERVAQVATDCGHQPFISYQEILQHGLRGARAFMPFVRQHIRTSDLLIVLYDPELRGGLVELGIAYAFEIPIWLCYPWDSQVSTSARGCAARQLAYANQENLASQLINLLSAPDFDISTKL